ncbi:MAG: phytanoyl-CoA dioxygenase family protein, partial [Pseudomonadota bacterium]
GNERIRVTQVASRHATTFFQGQSFVPPTKYPETSFYRHPTMEELEDPELIPIEVEKGSVAVWDGSVWHASGPRTIPGTRTVLHATYQRLYTQPIDNYTYLLQDDEYVKNASPELLSLLGADLFFGTATANSGGTTMKKFMHSANMSKQ